MANEKSDHPSSEVGLPENNEEEVELGGIHADEATKWRQLFEAQNKRFEALIAFMGMPKAEKNLILPEFNPEKPTANAHAWITTCGTCVGDQSIKGGALIKVLSSALKGSAADWLTQICYPDMVWEDFKNIFIARYDNVETSAAMFAKLFNSKPKEGECLTSYAASAVSAIMSKCNGIPLEEMVVAIVLAHIAQYDSSMKHLTFTTDVKTRNQLLNELQARAVNYKKRAVEQRMGEDGYQAKRFKFQNGAVMKCFKCAQPGHRAADCRNAELKGSLPNTEVTCFKCHKKGHYASQCLSKANMNSKCNYVVKKIVNLCFTSMPRGVLSHGGAVFNYVFDSGAECSIVKEHIAKRLSGKRFYDLICITGIGQSRLNYTLKILSVVKVDNINMEVLFHVLPDFAINFDLMLGRELLSLGMSVTITSDVVTLKKKFSVNCCETKITNFDLENIDTDIAMVEKPKLLSILKEFEQNFISGVPKHTAKVKPMQIRSKDDTKTVYRRPYRLSDSERQIVRKQIDEMLAAGIIRPSVSPYASPILLVKKKDGTDRMCIDFRELNDNTIPERFPLPLISEQIDRLQGSVYFTSLDLASGYHQIPIHSLSIEKTAFVTPDGHYEFLAIPFGLRNAPSVFQRSVFEVLGELARTYVVVYMDDILILGTSNIDETLERVRTVIRVLAESGFSFKLQKCKFLKKCIEYLGFEVSDGKIRPNTRKIEALIELPPPGTVTQLRQFIGLASYFRQFVSGFSQVMAPLYALTSKKHGLMVWTDLHENIRQKIISVLTSEPVLTLFDPECPCELHTDASSIGYGAVFMQKKNKKLQVIAYFSKRTTDAESRYHSFELETLAVVKAIKYFRHYLLDRKFTVITDCNALQASRKKRDLTPRVHRWWAFLQCFEFDIIYREGKRMCHVDFFSRNPLPIEQKLGTPTERKPKIENKEVNIAEITTNWLLAEQQRDAEISQIISNIRGHLLNEDILKTYEIRSGVLHRVIQRKGKSRCLPIIPRAFRWSLINSTHVSLYHLGYDKTLEKLYDVAWFEGMARYVKKFIDSCITCKVAKAHSGKIQAELHSIPKIQIPWHTVHVDATGKLSGKNDQKEYVFVFIDGFTKFVILRHTVRIDTASSLEALKSCVSLFGAPKRLNADQGRCFASSEFRSFCQLHNIELHLIAAGSSRANGQVERVMSTLKNMLTAVEISKESSWQNALSEIQLALNCTINRVTNYSPLELLIGKVARPLGLMAIDTEPEIDIENVREQASINMLKNAEYDKKRFDQSTTKVQRFVVGDFVLLQNEERHQTKLDQKYKGPFKVVEVLEGDRYTLAALDSNRTYKYAHDRLRKMPDNEDNFN